MKFKLKLKKTLLITFTLLIVLVQKTHSQTIPLPFQMTNNSEYSDDEIYVAVMGTVDNNFVWLDLETGETKKTYTSYNTLSAENGEQYANIFVKLSELNNNTIEIPIMKSSRIYYSFKKPLYFKFYGDNIFYSTPDMNNASDINYNTRWEFIEFNIENNGGIWANTSRVDFYQYPMGLEIYGSNNYYGKVGETMSHNNIINKWNSEVISPFSSCYDPGRDIIQAPSNLDRFKAGGSDEYYFSNVINSFWSKYESEDLQFKDANNQIWTGRVSNDIFYFTNQSTNKSTIINGKPTTHNVLSGAGLLWNDYSYTNGNDIDVQKHFTAALNRGVLNDSGASNTVLDWSKSSDYYTSSTYNGYSKFFHSDGVSYDSQTYTFALDDVFDHSSLLFTSQPTKAVVTIGGYSNSSCEASSITSYVNINYEGWNNTSSISTEEGDTVQFGPHPTSGGSWSWSGPNNFSHSSRSVTLTNLTSENAGTYIATYTNDCGSKSYSYITLSVTSDSATAPIGSTIWLKSFSNGQYVSSDQLVSLEGPLFANRYAYNSWELFTVTDANNGAIRLQSVGTGNYVRINPNNSTINSSGGLGNWTKLTWTNNQDGTISLLSNINGKFLSNNSTEIIANSSSITNTEKFTYAIVNSSKSFNKTALDKITSIFPNPASNLITIKFNTIENNTLQILSTTGQKILEKTTTNSNVLTLDISNLPIGIYLIKTLNENKLEQYKFIKK